MGGREEGFERARDGEQRDGAGDELIKSVARLLARRLRATDVIARMGGDEFAVLLRETDAATAQRVATDLLTEIRHHTAAIGGQRVSMTASIGVALLEDGDTDASQLLADADLAMYEAKRAGRDGVSVYSSERAREARHPESFRLAAVAKLIANSRKRKFADQASVLGKTRSLSITQTSVCGGWFASHADAHLEILREHVQ